MSFLTLVSANLTAPRIIIFFRIYFKVWRTVKTGGVSYFSLSQQ